MFGFEILKQAIHKNVQWRLVNGVKSIKSSIECARLIILLLLCVLQVLKIFRFLLVPEQTTNSQAKISVRNRSYKLSLPEDSKRAFDL